MKGHEAMKQTDEQPLATRVGRRPWTRPSIVSAGTVSAILRGGHGKVTVVTGDPGEPMKVPSTDH
jgi:hypothetical protein